MNIFGPIIQSQTLVKQLVTALSSNNKSETDHLLSSLESQLEQIKVNTSSLQQQITQLSKNQASSKKQASITIAKAEIKSGCYIFEGEKGFFCPRCYDDHGNKVVTARLNSKQRICPACRASIK